MHTLPFDIDAFSLCRIFLSSKTTSAMWEISRPLCMRWSCMKPFRRMRVFARSYDDACLNSIGASRCPHHTVLHVLTMLKYQRELELSYDPYKMVKYKNAETSNPVLRVALPAWRNLLGNFQVCNFSFTSKHWIKHILQTKVHAILGKSDNVSEWRTFFFSY